MGLIISQRLYATVQAVCPVDGVALLNLVARTVRIDFSASATQGQKDAANAAVAAFDWSAAADVAWQLQKDRADAIAIFLADTSPSAKVLRGAILALIDQLNIIRAALPAPLGAITVAQAKTAIQNKINGGTVD